MPAFSGKRIAVVGGGPGGLTLARLLEMRGAEVTVYERDRSRDARVQGSALDLHEGSGLAALEAAGLMEEFWKRHRADLDQLRLTDQHGTVLHDHRRVMEGEGKRPEIERGPLRDILLDSLRPGTVVWDRKLESAERRGGEIALHFAGGETAVADVAVAADGANSRMRALVTAIRPFYVGVSLVEGVVRDAARTVPELWRLLDGAALMALGGERTIGMGTKPDGSILFYAGLRCEEGEGQGALDGADTAAKRVAWFHARYPGWGDVWRPLFEQATSLVWRPLLACPSDQHWEPSPDATLLGDAAHVMPPYAGEGVNMAMLDALVLANALSGEGSVRDAVAAYETEMFARTRQIAAETMENTERFYAPDASEQVVRMFEGFASEAAAAALAAELTMEVS